MAQMVFLDTNVVSGPFQTEDEAILAQVAASRENAGQPVFPVEYILPFIAKGEAIPFGHRFPVRKGRLTTDQDNRPNRWYVLKQG
jgi:hypothetical protein